MGGSAPLESTIDMALGECRVIQPTWTAALGSADRQESQRRWRSSRQIEGDPRAARAPDSGRWLTNQDLAHNGGI